MREFFILLLAVLLWSLAFLALYRRQVRKAGPRETVSLLRRLFWGKGCCWEEGNYSVLLLYLVLKAGGLLLFACTLRFFLVPDYYGLLLLLFMAGGVFLAGGTFPVCRRRRLGSGSIPCPRVMRFSLPLSTGRELKKTGLAPPCPSWI